MGVGVLRHRRREHQRGVDRLAGQRALHPGMQRLAGVIAQGQRLAGQQCHQAAQPGHARVESNGTQVGAHGTQGRQVLQVVGVIDEGADEHLVALRHQMLEQMVRAHLVALVGRVGHAVHQIKQLGHGNLSASQALSPGCAR